MPSLRKLIVADSCAASRIRETWMDGHVHISGRNGRGKTTLIRLIPLFYGKQPLRIVRSAGSVVRSLREFMFSRSPSYPAFEYENHDGIKLSMLHFGADNSPQYHLADGPYAREIICRRRPAGRRAAPQRTAQGAGAQTESIRSE